MEVRRVIVGYLQTNCYLLIDNDNCIIVDPGDEAKTIIRKVGNLKVKSIFITHHHFDHIGALESLKEYYNVKENDFSVVDNMEVINTKGHTDDSLTFYFPKEKIMFCGDFLFQDSIGRTDLGGNNKDMLDSLNIISKYDQDIILYPGHGEKTTLKAEIANFIAYEDYLKNA